MKKKPTKYGGPEGHARWEFSGQLKIFFNSDAVLCEDMLACPIGEQLVVGEFFCEWWRFCWVASLLGPLALETLLTSMGPSHWTWAWIQSSLSEFSFSLTPSLTCEHSSSARSSASCRGPRSAWPSGVCSRIWGRRGRGEAVRKVLEWQLSKKKNKKNFKSWIY